MIEPYPTEIDESLFREIIETAPGYFEVGTAAFDSYDAARRYVTNKVYLDHHMRELLAFEDHVERMLGVREIMRGRVHTMIRNVSFEQTAAEADESEYEIAISCLAVEHNRHRRSVEDGLDTAAFRAEAYPDAIDAWAAGDIHSGHVRVIERAGQDLEPSLREAYEAEVLPQAIERSPSQLRRIARRIAHSLQSAPAPEKAIAAAQDRAVWLEHQSDGMAHLTIKTTAVLAEAAYDRLRSAARQAPAEDVRRMPQHMSDTAITTLITGTCEAGLGEGITAKVTLTMPATLVARGKTEPGMPHAELPSGTLIDDRTALLLAGGATAWTRLFTDPVSHVAVAADTYQPTASLRRFIIARDVTCRFPGCNQPATRCDIDHTHDWQYGGRTTPGNLAALCRHHHTLKHRLGPNEGWEVKHLSPGVLEWRAPDTRRHRVQLEPVPTAISPPNADPPVADDDAGWHPTPDAPSDDGGTESPMFEF